MMMRSMTRWFSLALVSAAATSISAQPDLVFMEPVEPQAPSDLPTYQRVDDKERVAQYKSWLDHQPGKMALSLHQAAAQIMIRRGDTGNATKPYHIALVPRGNHAASGFILESEDASTTFETLPYIKLDPSPMSFFSTFPHETGHVVLGLLAGENGIPTEPIASIPHTTSALTDRGTAFNEGFAIHLETIAAHLGKDPESRSRYHRESSRFGGSNLVRSEFLRHAVDLATFSQSVARYAEVRDNNFAFASAFNDASYLRIQLDKARDFATLRNANQLLQSEGFYASFFYAMTMRGDSLPTSQLIDDRHHRMLEALAEMFHSVSLDHDSPYLLHYIQSYMKLNSEHAGEIVDVILGLSHGVFVDFGAHTMWSDFYLKALNLDVRNLPKQQVAETREKWRAAILDNPATLFTCVGPQVPCTVEEVSVLLVAFGRPAPLAFDANTAQQGVIKLVPNITPEAVDRWLAQRAIRPFTDEQDYRQRVGQGEPWVSAIQFQ